MDLKNLQQAVGQIDNLIDKAKREGKLTPQIEELIHSYTREKSKMNEELNNLKDALRTT